MNIWHPSDFLYALLLALLAVAIHLFIKWMDTQLKADSTISDHDAKICRYARFILRIFFYIAVAFSIGLIALPPIAFLLTALLGKAFSLFDRYGGVAIIIVGIAVWWKNRQSKQATVPAAVTDVDIELAHQRGVELQKVMLALLFRIICATRNLTNAIPPDDASGIAISTTSGESFYMDGEVVVYQTEVQVSGEITPELEDKIQDELQNAVPKYISDYPALIDPFAKGKGYPPVEILAVQKSGKRVIIDTVITTEKSLPIITNRRQARAERKLKQKSVTPPDITIFR